MFKNSIKVIVFIVSLVPVVYLAWGLFSNQLGANPIEVITRETGQWALRFLILTLAITPLVQFTKWHGWIKFRRMLGLFAFFYTTVHMLLYLGLDQFFDWHEIWLDIIKRPFITIGFLNYILLIPLAMTSTNKMMKKMGGARWKKLHKLIYPISLMAALHFIMLVKADLREPLVYLGIIVLLLLIRVIRNNRLIWRFSH